MSDNFPVTPGSGRNVASDQVTYSGDLADVQLLRPVLVTGTEGSKTVVDLPGDATNGLDIDVTRMPAGSSAAQVQGTVAHDSAAANNPVLTGLTAATAMPTAVADADVVRAIGDIYGRQIVVLNSMPEKWEKYTSPSDITDTADDAVFGAVGSVKHYITHFSAMNAHATVGTWVYLKDGSTVIYSGYCAAGGGGFAATFPTPIAGTANTAINVANATTGAATRVNVSGYQAP